MIQVTTAPDSEVPSLVLSPDTGESGETYDIEVQTTPWLRSRLSRPVRFSKTSDVLLDTSESGETYEAQAEALFDRATRADRPRRVSSASSPT